MLPRTWPVLPTCTLSEFLVTRLALAVHYVRCVLFCAFIPVITYTRMYVFDAYLLVAFPVAVSTLLALEMETT